MPDPTPNQTTQTPSNAAAAPAAPAASATQAPWYGEVAPEVAQVVNAKGWKGPGDVISSYVNLEKMSGSRVAIPAADAPKAEWDAFHAKLGRPESAEGYGEYTPPEAIASAWDKDLERRFAGVAHEAGLTPRQVKQLMDWHANETVNMIEGTGRAAVEGHEMGMAALRKAWGPNTDRNTAMVQQTIAKAGDAELVDLLNEPLQIGGQTVKLGNHPAFLKFVYKFAEGLMEDGELPNMPAGTTVDDAKAEISKLESDPSFFNRDHANHKATIDRLRELYQVVYPG